MQTEDLFDSRANSGSKESAVNLAASAVSKFCWCIAPGVCGQGPLRPGWVLFVLVLETSCGLGLGFSFGTLKDLQIAA